MTERGLMVDVLGKLIVELRDDTAVHAIVSDRVGGPTVAADWAGTGVAYVKLTRLGPIRRKPRAAMMSGRVLLDAFGRTDQEAAALYGACSDVLSAKGPRRSAGGVAIYLSIEEIGGQYVLDPDSDQPVERSIYVYSAPLARASS